VCVTDGHCWCADLPHAIPLTDPQRQGCLCPPCLTQRIADLPRAQAVAETVESAVATARTATPPFRERNVMGDDATAQPLRLRTRRELT
jgi:hypothetical protein